MALKTSGYDFTAIEGALQRVHNALSVSAVAPELFFKAVREVQFTLDFYPPERTRATKFEFASAKSRRWFWWAVSEGIIQIPYRRTGRLRDATELQVLRAEPQRFVIAVTVDVTKARYADFVIGRRQVPGHKTTGWDQLYTSVQDATPGLSKALEPLYTRELRGYLKAGF